MATDLAEPKAVEVFSGPTQQRANGHAIFQVAIACKVRPFARSFCPPSMVDILFRIHVPRFAKWGVLCLLVFLKAQAQDLSRSVPEAFPLAEKVFPQLAPLLQKAIEQSPRGMAANLDFLIAQENVQMARARTLPQAGGYLTYSYARDRRLDRADALLADKLAYNFSVTQPLYHWGALKAGTRLSELAARASENNFAEVCRLLVLEIRATYLRLVILKASRERAAFAYRLAGEEETRVREQIKAGALPPASILEAENKVKQTRLDLDRAEEEFRYAKVSVERLAGSDVLADGSIPSLIPRVGYAEDQIRVLEGLFKADPVKGNFRLASAQLRLDQEKLNYQVIDKTLRPKFNAVTGVMQDEVSYTGSPADRARTQSFYGGLNVTWNIFDGFSTPAQRRASRLRQRQLEEERDDRRREISETVQSQIRQIDFSARSLALGESNLDQYNLFVTKKAEDIAFGASAPSELDGITIARDAVLIQAMIQRSDLMVRMAEFLSTIGRDPALASVLPPPP